MTRVNFDDTRSDEKDPGCFFYDWAFVSSSHKLERSSKFGRPSNHQGMIVMEVLQQHGVTLKRFGGENRRQKPLQLVAVAFLFEISFHVVLPT